MRGNTDIRITSFYIFSKPAHMTLCHTPLFLSEMQESVNKL